MPIATLQNVEKSFGSRIIFDHVDFEIDRGERVGLIGENGTGKTTLLKLLTGAVEAESGIISIAKSIRVGHLTQDPVFDPTNTVMDEAELAFAELHDLAHKMRDIEHAMADQTGDALEKTLRQYQTVQHDFDLAGGYAWQHKLEATLLGVGLPSSGWEQNVATLSGGQKSRLALAKLLVSAPDLLLLDEPTNHLDLAAIEWLEKYLLDFSGAVLLISHDRYLLDRLATRIVWLTRQKLPSYPGNYSAFVKQREVQELSQQRSYEQQQEYIEKQKEFVRRFGAGQRSKEAKGREKRLNRLLKSDDMVRALENKKSIKLKMEVDRRAGDAVLTVRDLSKSYGENRLWQNVNFDVRRGERIGIIGPNGSGKTTMLRALLGQEEVDDGSLKWGANLQLGYYDQRLDDFDPDNTIMEELRVDRPDEKDQNLHDILGAMLFRGDDVHKQMGLLSGGERARVALAELLLDQPNVILLDEPTNHLDIASREALEAALANFTGTILCVSHDRYFLEKIVQRLLIVKPPEVIAFTGTYHEWVARGDSSSTKKATNAKTQAPAKPIGNPVAQKKQTQHPKRDNPYARPFGKLSMQQLEQEITDSEIAIADCQAKFGDGAFMKDVSAAKRVQADYEALSKKLKGLEAEYFHRSAD